MDVLSTAGRGLMAAGNRLAASAGRVSRMGFDETVDLTHEVVEQVKAKQEWKANLQVIRFADEMWQALLDIQSRR
jgi:flagellar basal body rod protein FlgC